MQAWAFHLRSEPLKKVILATSVTGDWRMHCRAMLHRARDGRKCDTVSYCKKTLSHSHERFGTRVPSVGEAVEFCCKVPVVA